MGLRVSPRPSMKAATMTFYDTTEVYSEGPRRFHAAWTEVHEDHVNLTAGVARELAPQAAVPGWRTKVSEAERLLAQAARGERGPTERSKKAPARVPGLMGANVAQPALAVQAARLHERKRGVPPDEHRAVLRNRLRQHDSEPRLDENRNSWPPTPEEMTGRPAIALPNRRKQKP